MNKAIRTSLVLAALATAAASQAFDLTYIGTSYNVPQTNGFTTRTVDPAGFGDFFNFGASKTVATNSTTGTITLYKTLAALQANGPDYVLLNYTLDTPSGTTVTATATATGQGSYAIYSGTGVRVARNNVNVYGIDIQGKLDAVPEPASLAALGVGAVALLRRRKKA